MMVGVREERVGATEVAAPDGQEPTTGEQAVHAGHPGAQAHAAEEEAAEAAERQREVSDLTHRVLAGAVLTLPVLFAVIAHDLFRAGWAPQELLDRLAQPVLITPLILSTVLAI